MWKILSAENSAFLLSAGDFHVIVTVKMRMDQECFFLFVFICLFVRGATSGRYRLVDVGRSVSPFTAFSRMIDRFAMPLHAASRHRSFHLAGAAGSAAAVVVNPEGWRRESILRGINLVIWAAKPTTGNRRVSQVSSLYRAIR